MTVARSGGRLLVAGSANVDFVVKAPRIPSPGETVLGGDLVIHPGGKGANQAVAAARAGAARTSMLAAIGDDDLAGVLKVSLQTAGVDLQLCSSARPTGAALITVDADAENAITVAPGANLDLRPDSLPSLDEIGWLVMQLEIPIETVTAFAKQARASDTKVLLNAAPAQTLERDLLSEIDVLVVNEEELGVMVGTAGSIADRLQRSIPKTTIVTLGQRGVCWLSEGEVSLQPAFVVNSVDTTAAGDTFCGVLAAGLSEDLPLPAAIERAAAAAALATTRHGAQSSIPTAVEVDQFLTSASQRDRNELSLYCGAGAAVD